MPPRDRLLDTAIAALSAIAPKLSRNLRETVRLARGGYVDAGEGMIVPIGQHSGDFSDAEMPDKLVQLAKLGVPEAVRCLHALMAFWEQLVPCTYGCDEIRNELRHSREKHGTVHHRPLATEACGVRARGVRARSRE